MTDRVMFAATHCSTIDGDGDGFQVSVITFAFANKYLTRACYQALTLYMYVFLSYLTLHCPTFLTSPFQEALEEVQFERDDDSDDLSDDY
jgi:hypothetical protein